MSSPTIITLPNKDNSILENQYGTGNYTVKLSETLKFSGDYEVYLLSATIPYTWYTLTEENNTLTVKHSGVIHEIKISPGNINCVLALIKEIEVHTSPFGIDLSADEKTMRTKILVGPNSTISGPLLELLGFHANTKLLPGAFISPNIADITGLGRLSSLLIYISIINNTYVGSFEAPLLAQIPIKDTKPGDIIHWQASGPDYETHKLKNSSFQTIEIDIRDSKGNSINFHNRKISVRIGIRKSN